MRSFITQRPLDGKLYNDGFMDPGCHTTWPPQRLPSRHLDMSRTMDMAPLNKGDTRGRRGQGLVSQTRRKPQVLSFQYYYIGFSVGVWFNRIDAVNSWHSAIGK